MSNISSTIKGLREQVGLSQTQLAQKAGVSGAFISKLEANQYQTVSLDKCQQLAKGLGLTLKDLLNALGLLENKATPTASYTIRKALRGNGFSGDEAEQILNFAAYLRKNRKSNE